MLNTEKKIYDIDFTQSEKWGIASDTIITIVQKERHFE